LNSFENNKDFIDQNCSELLRNTKKEIKKTSYKLSTVVSDGEYHRKVHANYPEDLEVIEDTLMFCKIQCFDGAQSMKMKSAHNSKLLIRVSVKYFTRSDLAVYASFKNKAPDQTNSDYSYKNPRKFYITVNGKDKNVDNQFLYL
jgi:hypothetical protein